MAPELIGMGYVASRQAFTDEPLGDTAARVDDAAKRFGFEVVSVRAARGISAAPMVVLRAPSLATLDRYRELVPALFGPSSSPRYEGYAIEVRDTAGQPLVRATAAFRTGAGRVWNDSRVTTFLGFLHGPSPPANASRLALALGATGGRAIAGKLSSLTVRLHSSGAGTVDVTAYRAGTRIVVGRVRFARAGWRTVNLRPVRYVRVSRGMRMPVVLHVRGQDLKRRPLSREWKLRRVPIRAS